MKGASGIDSEREGADPLLRLPKPELHVHLDGSLRPATMFELAAERGVVLPGSTPSQLADHMLVRDAARLEDYLERFALTLSVMQDAEALERITSELVLDHAAESVPYLEVRFCPALSTEQALRSEDVVEAVLRGLRHGEQMAGAPIRAALIVCALRSLPTPHSVEMAELSVAYHARGVCGFDLAGAEHGYPVRDHEEAFHRAASAGVPITIHAGEGYGPASIREAIELGHARRIGHGTRLREDAALLDLVRARRIPLEVCITSNVQTRVVPSSAQHPVADYVRAGIPVSLGTDNRLMSGVTLTDEYRLASTQIGFSFEELVAIARTGLDHAFVSEHVREELGRDFDEVVARLY